jgi:hypothetical protein
VDLPPPTKAKVSVSSFALPQRTPSVLGGAGRGSNGRLHPSRCGSHLCRSCRKCTSGSKARSLRLCPVRPSRCLAMAHRATILLRIDWLPWWIGALLWRVGAAKAASGSCPAGLICPGGAEVVLRMASRKLQGFSMTKPKTKAKVATRSASPKVGKSKSRSRHAAAASKAAGRSNTKHARIIAMLRAPAGTTIAAIMTVTEWQQHSVRGFLAGVVRKKLGLNLVSEPTDKGRIYRIKDGKASSAALDRTKQAA